MPASLISAAPLACAASILEGAAIGERDLWSLGSFKHVLELDLRKCSLITDAGLDIVGRLTSLSQLILACCPGITDAGVARMAGLTALRERDLSWTGISNVGLQLVGALSSLERLGLARCTGDLGPLACLTKLRSLNLYGCGLRGGV